MSERICADCGEPIREGEAGAGEPPVHRLWPDCLRAVKAHLACVETENAELRKPSVKEPE